MSLVERPKRAQTSYTLASYSCCVSRSQQTNRWSARHCPGGPLTPYLRNRKEFNVMPLSEFVLFFVYVFTYLSCTASLMLLFSLGNLILNNSVRYIMTKCKPITIILLRIARLTRLICRCLFVCQGQTSRIRIGRGRKPPRLQSPVYNMYCRHQARNQIAWRQLIKRPFFVVYNVYQ